MNNLIKVRESLVKELVDASKGKKTSLPFIKHILSNSPLVDSNEIFQTIVIGGSYYHKATLKKTNGNLYILHYDNGVLSSFQTKDDLFNFLESHLEPNIKVLSLNFAYPMLPMSRDGVFDGTLLASTKENTFEGLENKAVGEEFEKYIQKKYSRTLQVACANDTICLLLSGLMHHSWYNLATGIVGTGLNFALFLDKHTVVNLESGNFNKFTQSEAGKTIDAESNAHGGSLYEKEVSGAYLYKHFNFLAKQRNLDIEPITSTKTIDSLTKDKNPEIAATATEVIQHSAELVSAQIAGIMQFCQRDLTFIMQGSLYWKGTQYKETVEKLVAELCPEFKATYEQVLHSDIYGAAKLVT